MVGDVLFVSTSFSQVAAIDAATGRTVWVYDPETWTHGTPSNNGFVHRGVGYWAAGDDRSILFGTGDGYLICLNARRGRPIPTFGDGGRIDLTHGLGRPVDRKLYGVFLATSRVRRPRDHGVEGARHPAGRRDAAGYVRGFDVRSGGWAYRRSGVPPVGTCC